jgi:methionine aminopeptidase
MTLAIEPMLIFGNEKVFVADDYWRVKTVDRKLAVHCELTIFTTEILPEVLTLGKNDFGIQVVKQFNGKKHASYFRR